LPLVVELGQQLWCDEHEAIAVPEPIGYLLRLAKVTEVFHESEVRGRI
jgi:hypothetical protein